MEKTFLENWWFFGEAITQHEINCARMRDQILAGEPNMASIEFNKIFQGPKKVVITDKVYEDMKIRKEPMAEELRLRETILLMTDDDTDRIIGMPFFTPFEFETIPVKEILPPEESC